MASTRSERQAREGSYPSRSAYKLRSRLLAALEERELSRTQLSSLTEIPYKVLRRLLRQDADPTLEHALRISHALGIEVEELFALEPGPAGISATAQERAPGLRRERAP
jgi:plasmid maintenance system antidote protein VapI